MDKNKVLEEKLTIIEGYQTSDSEKNNLEASELYFTNRVYIDLIRIVKNTIEALPENDICKQNFIRRSSNLFKKAEDYFYNGLFVNTSENTKTFKSEVFNLLEELKILAEDLKLINTAEEIFEIIYNEACNEIVNNLMTRTGREQSAGVLAVHFGLVDNEEALNILECLDLKPQEFTRAVNAAWHDLSEIQSSLNFKGDIKKIFYRNLEIAFSEQIN